MKRVLATAVMALAATGANAQGYFGGTYAGNGYWPQQNLGQQIMGALGLGQPAYGYNNQAYLGQQAYYGQQQGYAPGQTYVTYGQPVAGQTYVQNVQLEPVYHQNIVPVPHVVQYNLTQPVVHQDVYFPYLQDIQQQVSQSHVQQQAVTMQADILAQANQAFGGQYQYNGAAVPGYNYGQFGYGNNYGYGAAFQ